MAGGQLTLFKAAPVLPDGLTYAADFITAEEERDLARALASLPFAPFEFQGFLGNRRTVSFGWRYGFDGTGLRQADAMPDFLLPLRERAGRLAGVEPVSLEHALCIEYAPGAGIGWHKDRPVFGDVLGISLLAPCRLRFRRKLASGWERASTTAEPRSAYLLQGPARAEWEHSIPPLDRLRYSITFRTLRPDAARQ